MADDTDVLLKMYEEQWEQARQTENQRAAITNIVLVIASAVLGFIVQRGLNLEMLPLTILLIVIGIYGAIASEKLYETFQFHVGKAWSWRKRIDELHPNAQLLKLNEESRKKHRAEFPRLVRLRLHHMWMVLHLAIALGGIILTFAVIIR